MKDAETKEAGVGLMILLLNQMAEQEEVTESMQIDLAKLQISLSNALGATGDKEPEESLIKSMVRFSVYAIDASLEATDSQDPFIEHIMTEAVTRCTKGIIFKDVDLSGVRPEDVAAAIDQSVSRIENSKVQRHTLTWIPMLDTVMLDVLNTMSREDLPIDVCRAATANVRAIQESLMSVLGSQKVTGSEALRAVVTCFEATFKLLDKMGKERGYDIAQNVTEVLVGAKDRLVETYKNNAFRQPVLVTREIVNLYSQFKAEGK